MATTGQPQQQGSDLTIWEQRWIDLDGVLQDLGDFFGPSTLLNFTRKETLHNLVQCLQSFARDQFYFFYDGLNGQHKLLPSAEFPIEFVLQAVIAQMTYDLEVILRAADQRISASQHMKRTLDTADKLAWKALQPAKDYGWISQDTTVLTYFQKSPAIRIIPYTSIALIGIPFTTVAIDRDYLAIPHEVGHYVYRNGTFEIGNARKPIFRVLDQELTASPPWLKTWLEEIFADVYGALIGGPVIGLSAQDLAMQASLQEFTDNEQDKTHPTPILRPDIYTHVLEMTSGKLASRWARKRDSRPVQPITVTAQREVLIQAVDKAVELLQEMVPVTKWTEDVGSKEDVETLFDKFKGFVADTENNGVPLEELKPCITEELWLKWIQREKFFENGSPPSVPAEIRSGIEDDLKREPNDTWLHVALAGGWSTKIGNHSNP